MRLLFTRARNDDRKGTTVLVRPSGQQSSQERSNQVGLSQRRNGSWNSCGKSINVSNVILRARDRGLGCSCTSVYGSTAEIAKKLQGFIV